MKRFQPYQVAQTLWTQLRSSPTNDGTASTPSEAGRATYRVQARNSLVTVLPEDVLVLIFRLLDPQDLIICQMVCIIYMHPQCESNHYLLQGVR